MTDTALTSEIAFGRCVVRAEARQLLRDGRPVKLGARAYDVLLALIERRHRVVDKNELLDLVWPGLVVEESNLQVQVSGLRKLLGPDAIATIPGRGYRFTAALRGDGAARAGSSPDAPYEPTTTPTALVPPVMIGCDEDKIALAQSLASHRLVTVVGHAGVGKTSLTKCVAADAAARGSVVAWVELAPLSDPALIVTAIAQALQLPGGSDPLAQAARAIDALVVLDNAEHLLDGVAVLLQELLGAAPGLRFLVTSQAPLKIEGEQLYRLHPLPCPAQPVSAEEALRYGAVALFVDQARIADRRFVLDEANVDAVIEVCRRLDGVALALRLAAARLPLLGLSGLRSGLARRFEVLGGGLRGAPAHQHTLRAAFDWSHGQLQPTVRKVFRRLAVFPGGFDLDAACSVCGDAEGADHSEIIDALSDLVDRALVAVDPGEPPRYRLLQTAREYAAQQLLLSGEAPEFHRRQASYLLKRLRHAWDDYWERGDDEGYVALEPELANLHAAVDFLVANESPLAVALAGEAHYLLVTRGLLHEAGPLSRRVQPYLDETTDPQVLGLFWMLRAFASLNVDGDETADACLLALRAMRDAGDRRWLAYCITNTIIFAPTPLALKHELRAELEAVWQPTWPAFRRYMLHLADCAIAREAGDDEAARTALLQALRLMRSRRARAENMGALVTLELSLGRIDDAVEHARKSEAIARTCGLSIRVTALASLGAAYLERGDLGAARAALDEGCAVSRRVGWWGFLLLCCRMAGLALAEGRSADAARLLGFARTRRRTSEQEHRSLYHWWVHTAELIEDGLRAEIPPARLAQLEDEGAALDEGELRKLALAAAAS